MNRAFTLIELMIVVAMIIIVATIAVQNFTGNKTVNDNGIIAPTTSPHQPPSKPIRDSGKIER